MSYYMARTVVGAFDAVVADVIEQLKRQGFGVLTDIDVQATLKAKAGLDMPRYRILGACNPGYAHRALQIEDKLGVLLPCNVIVRQQGEAEVEVASIDPITSLERTGNSTLAPVAREVREQLAAVLAALAPRY
jgi:uncharacterized protein (DUF302 family)